MADLGAVGALAPQSKSITLDVFNATSWTHPRPAQRVSVWRVAATLDIWAAKNITLNPIRTQGQLVRYLEDPLPQDWKTFSGTVLDASNNPVARTVRVVRRSDGYELGETTSSAVTGAWSITLPATSEVQIICLDDAAGTLENDLVHRVMPA